MRALVHLLSSVILRPVEAFLSCRLADRKFSIFVVLLMLLGGTRTVFADAVVVFNEIMYHPATNETGLEWLELHNQMAVNVDLSGWSISGGIDYSFPEGTVITGNGYLVVALSPSDLQTATGITNLVGPYTGRLSNSGDTLKLRNKNKRIMDSISYGVDGQWPCAPDGSGVSLSKYNEDGASDTATNWTMSSLVGGTPGKQNFSTKTFETTSSTPVTSMGTWRYLASDATPTSDWKNNGFDDSSWTSASSPFVAGETLLPSGSTQNLPVFNTGVDSNGVSLSSTSLDPHYVLTLSAQSTPPPPDISATVMHANSAWLASDTTSKWIGAVSSGSSSVAAGNYNFRTTFDLTGFAPNTAQLIINVACDNGVNDIQLNGISQGFTYVGYSSWSGALYINSGFVSGTNTLDFFTYNEAGGDNPAGFRAKVSGTAKTLMATSTTLSSNLTTYYFRTAFDLNAAPKNSLLQLSAYIADGAVIYLNGNEVRRINMPSGTISSDTRAVTNVTGATYFGPYTLPTASLVRGTNVLAVEIHRATNSTSALFASDVSMTTTNFLTSDKLPLAFNEFGNFSNNVAWIELINTGTTNINPQDCLLVRQRSDSTNREYTLPSQDMAPGATLLLAKETLGFGVDSGDTFFLYTPDQSSVIDAFVASGKNQARYPDGTGQWLTPSEPTPGESNKFSFHNEIVINEIMYNPPADQYANGIWIELYNRSSNAVDITGWKLSKDISYTFSTGTIIASDSYLVVAKDTAWIQTNYPGVSAVGPFGGNLKHGHGHIKLSDESGNPVDEINYYGSAPWPEYPNGGGASLELRDPWADNTKPEAWAASDESSRSVWTNISYTMSASQTLGPTLWNEFVMGLLDQGECLISDMHAIESPSSSATELLQNGSFTQGINTWRALGDHSDSYVQNIDGTSCLHLIATGPTEHMHNHLETTLVNNHAIVNGKEYKIAFNAKWLAGNNRLNTRLYFNRAAQTIALPVPLLHGTPGSKNTVFATHIGPTYFGLSHSPITPKSTQPVTVSIAARASQGLGAITLYWAVNEGTWQTTAMEAASASDQTGYTNYSAVIPAQANGSLIQFYVLGADTLGTTASYPSEGKNSRALYKVVDSTLSTALHQIRLLMTTSDATYLYQATNVMGNNRMKMTVVYDDNEVFYDAGLHLQSSERGRDQTTRVGFSVKLPADHLFRGTIKTFTIDRSGGQSGLGGKQDEIILWQAVNHAGGIPGLYNDIVQCYAPRSQEDGHGTLRLCAFDKDYFDSQYDNGGDGNQYKMELIYYPTSTATGDVESPKLPEPDDVINVEFQDWGNDKESYRWIFLQENNADIDDYSQIITLNKAFALTGTTLDTQMNTLMDVDEYLRTLAFKAFTGDQDTYTYGYSHNWIIYFRPDTGKAMGLLWDMDYSYCASTSTDFPGTGSANTYKLVTRPTFYRMYYNHLLDIMATTMNSTYLTPWASHYSSLVGEDWSKNVTYLQTRADYIKSKMPGSAPFAITSNGGRNYSISASRTILTGTSPLTVKDILVNGAAYSVSWTTLTNWSISVPLPLQVNTLTFQGYDNQGTAMSNATATITVTNTTAVASQYVVINEWMADNSGPGGVLDPDENLYSDWLELYNPNTISVDLSGCYMTDSLDTPTKWQIPTNTIIAPQGFLLIWADKLTNLNTSATNTALHANFKLSKSGSDLGLYGSDKTPWHTLTFGTQYQNVSQGFYPDGNTNSPVFMTNWTPCAANQIGLPTGPTLSLTTLNPDGTLTLTVQAPVGKTYCVEYKNDLNDSAWTPISTNRVTSTDPITINDNIGTEPQRFYRATILQ